MRETGNRRSLISYLARSRAKFHFDDGASGDFYPVCQDQPGYVNTFQEGENFMLSRGRERCPSKFDNGVAVHRCSRSPAIKKGKFINLVS